jgi:hypothetical protein
MSNPLQKSNKTNPEDNYNLCRQIAVCQTKRKNTILRKMEKPKKNGCEVGFAMVCSRDYGCGAVGWVVLHGGV